MLFSVMSNLRDLNFLRTGKEHRITMEMSNLRTFNFGIRKEDTFTMRIYDFIETDKETESFWNLLFPDNFGF